MSVFMGLMGTYPVSLAEYRARRRIEARAAWEGAHVSSALPPHAGTALHAPCR
ncbi:hypothetical protein FHS32_006769 [Streptomyces albaduncus]|uniref:Uncharacterized protein n=1 Tax=Streptomyces griseoloalbus TaxID=67303 RepID=A0A7W8BYE9_9ACTN|nr:hypothetical protein [Streptomyces albaduncus]GGV66144.1 hypothetical protein GCM10010294_19330 [Streptomyces griseoloalbus]GGW63813.1 hypothetical protein GCM10010340_47560 [Streptomyces albaduncus]